MNVIMKIIENSKKLRISFALVCFLYPITVFWISSYFVLDPGMFSFLIKPLMVIASLFSFLAFSEQTIGIQYWFLPLVFAALGWSCGKVLEKMLSPDRRKQVFWGILIASVVTVGLLNIYLVLTSGPKVHILKSDFYDIKIQEVSKSLDQKEILVLIYPFRDGPGLKTSLKYEAELSISKGDQVYFPEKKKLNSYGVKFPYVEPPFKLRIVNITVYDPKPIFIPLNREIKIKKLWENFLIQ